MKKAIFLVVIMSLAAVYPAMALNEDKLIATLLNLGKALKPLSQNGELNGKGSAGEVSNPANDDFIWLRAEKVNKQLEAMISGIETAKGVATALAVIINLYESDKISVDVALTAIQILKLRAVFLKVFISNGESELEIMIHVLNEHEAEFSQKAKENSSGKTTVNIGAKGKIKASQP